MGPAIERSHFSAPNVPKDLQAAFHNAIKDAENGDHILVVSHKAPVRVGTEFSGFTPEKKYASIQLAREQFVEETSARGSRLLLSSLKWTAAILCTALVTALIGYLVASRWYDRRIVNPYGVGYGTYL